MTFKEMLLAFLLSKNSKSNKVNNLLPNKDLRGSIIKPRIKNMWVATRAVYERNFIP